jgi:hypothetical protein
MKNFLRLLIFVVVIGILFYISQSNGGIRRVRTMLLGSSGNAVTEQMRPNVVAIFGKCNCQQWIDRFGNVSRSAFDASGNRIGTQVGHVGGPRGIMVEMTYLVPDAQHPFGQAFDGDGNPRPLNIGPDNPIEQTQQGGLVS